MSGDDRLDGQGHPYAVCVAAFVLVLAGCARALPPPGGETDRDPPRVIETVPPPMTVQSGFDGEVVFRFDERISERGVDASAVVVSPRSGRVTVSRGRREIRVAVEGGWQPGMIHRVILVPGISDLFSNATREPAELAFSTGPEFPQTVIGGLVSDRITGRPAPLAMVEASVRGDSSVVYVTAADSAAFFSFRFLPPALYDVVAFTDQNRNRRRDPAEAYSRIVAVPINRDTDTIVVENVAIVPADTTPPRITRAEARDTIGVRLSTDDWLDPSIDLQSVQVRLVVFPDSTTVPGEHRLMTVDSFAAWQRSVADTAVADTAAADTLPAHALAVRALTPGPRPAQPGGIPMPELPLPYQEIVLIPGSPLAPGGRYRVTIDGLLNISGRSGSAALDFAMPERRPTRPDTTATAAAGGQQREWFHGRRAPRDPAR